MEIDREKESEEGEVLPQEREEGETV